MYTIAARNTLHKTPVNVCQRNRQTVVFHLAAYLKILAAKSFPYTLVEVGHILLVISI